MTWMVPLDDLDLPQLRAVELPTSSNFVLEGAPGSGKSLVLVHRAAQLVERGVDPERILIVAYTNALEEYLRSGAVDLDLPGARVRTFDSLCGELFRELVGGSIPAIKDSKRYQRDYAEIRRQVAGALDKLDGPKFDVIMVDEGQDFDDEAYRILLGVGAHLTVAADSRQQLYQSTTVDDIAEAIGAPVFSLAWGFRSTPEVIRVASSLGGFDSLEDFATVDPHDIPVLIGASSSAEQDAAMIEAIKGRLYNEAERCAVLVPDRRRAFAVARMLEEAGIDAENPKELDFDSDAVKVMTVHSAKGLTFTSVFLPHLDAEVWGKRTPDERGRLLFVAASRASQWLHMSYTRGTEIDELDQLRDLPTEILAQFER